MPAPVAVRIEMRSLGASLLGGGDRAHDQFAGRQHVGQDGHAVIAEEPDADLGPAGFLAFADDDMELFVNGVRFVNDSNSSPTTVTNLDITSALVAGTNVIAARVTNVGGDRGFAARLEIDTERSDAGDTLATALNTGVVPGMPSRAVRGSWRSL